MKKKVIATIWLLIYIFIIAGYILWLYFAMGLKIKDNSAIRSNYAGYLISQNDKFIEQILITDNLFNSSDRVYTEDEKTLITNSIEDQNYILRQLQNNPPDSSNLDYKESYQKILKTIGFYIQGELMQAEYTYASKETYVKEEDTAGSVEGYIMGKQLCNIVGNLVLGIPNSVNAVRNTDIKSSFEIANMTEEEFDELVKSTGTIDELATSLSE